MDTRDIKKILNNDSEKPLDKLVSNVSFAGIFRRIGCVGDSLASGEMESLNDKKEPGYHDYYEYSWGQYMARNAGLEAFNFSKGGMTAAEYCESFADEKNFWSPRFECQAYIIALGVNDITKYGKDLGSTDDIDISDWRNNKKTFAGYYAQIIQRLKEIQPKAKFFLMTIPRGEYKDAARSEAEDIHQNLLYKMAEIFDYTYVMDMREYSPVIDAEFRKTFFLGGHLNPMGYILYANMIESYLDYIIRHNMDDFVQTAFVGTAFHNISAKW